MNDRDLSNHDLQEDGVSGNSDLQEDRQRFWRLARSLDRPHIRILQVLYGQDLKALVTMEVYDRTSGLDVTERQKRNIFQELDDLDLLDYERGNPSVLVKKDLEFSVKKLVRAWNEANSV